MRNVISIEIELEDWLVEFIDHKVLARGGKAKGVGRATIIEPVLKKFALDELHEANVIARWVKQKGLVIDQSTGTVRSSEGQVPE